LEFRIKELGFSVQESDFELASKDNDAICSIEDIAKDSAVRVRMISDSSDLSSLSIGESKEVIASSESIEVVIRISLDLVILGIVGLLSEFVDRGQIFVHFIGGIHIGPEGFSALGIRTAAIILFTTVVNDGNTNRSQRESSSSLENSVITIEVEESSVIMVINKVAQESLIRPSGSGTSIVGLQVIHGIVLLEDPTKSVEEGIVQNTANWSLISSSIRHIRIKDFTDSVDSRSLGEFSPEVLGNIRNGIDSKTINVISVDHVSNPGKESASNEIVVLVKISELSEPAGFLFGLVVGIDITAINISMVVLGFVEGEFVIVNIRGRKATHVISNNINHDPDVLIVASFNEILEIIGGTKVRIDFINIGGSVTMIVSWHIGNDRRDPNSIKSHTFDVVEIVDDSLEGSSAIVAPIITLSSASVSSGISISKELIDGTIAPFFRSTSKRDCYKKSKEEDNGVFHVFFYSKQKNLYVV